MQIYYIRELESVDSFPSQLGCILTGLFSTKLQLLPPINLDGSQKSRGPVPFFGLLQDIKDIWMLCMESLKAQE